MNQQSTLGQTLEREVGVAATYYGPNASRPVIRGLGGFDVRLLANGLGVLDASSASPDHAVAVSPFAVDRIEVVRGAATVLYGGSAIGGVVNTIDSRIARDPRARPVDGAASYLHDSASRLNAGGGRIDAGDDRFALHADAFGSRNGDLRIPGAAWSPAVQAARGDAGPQGTLPNSQGSSATWGLGATAFLADKGFVGVSYGAFDTDYGTVAEPGVTIDLSQRTWNAAGEVRDALPGFPTARFRFGHGDYTHTELDAGIAGTVFDSKGWNLRLEGLHERLGPLEGAIGAEVARASFSAKGEEAFLPSTVTRSAALFAYEEARESPWRLSFGGRIEDVAIDADAFAAAGKPADSVRFVPWSVALGAFRTLGPGLGAGVNVQSTQRAPSAQELFADGPHVATGQFEVGDRSLRTVSAYSVDLALKRTGEGTDATIGAFYARFPRFIGLFPTDVWRGPDRSVAPGPEPYIDPVTGEEVTPLQQFDYREVSARFYGIEAQATFPIWTSGGNVVSARLQADYVNATDLGSGQPLPFIPPLRFGATAIWQSEGFTASIGGLFADAQRRVPAFQAATPGYADVRADASYRFDLGPGWRLEAYAQLANILDQTIRYSTSALKDVAPAPGRSLRVGVRATF